MAYKGQLSADFYIALVVFLGVIAYITFQLFQIVPASSANVKEEYIRIEAYQLSELLINDGGEPNDWHDAKYVVGDIKRIGLSDSTKSITNFLSSQKISRFKTICSNFDDIKNLLDVTDETSFTIIKHTPVGDVIDTCKSTTPSNKRTSFSVGRTALIDGTNYPTEIIVEVWRK